MTEELRSLLAAHAEHLQELRELRRQIDDALHNGTHVYNLLRDYRARTEADKIQPGEKPF